MNIGFHDDPDKVSSTDGFAAQFMHLDDCIFTAGVAADRPSARSDRIHDILGMLRVGLSCVEVALRAVVEVLESLINGVTCILLLALEMKGEFLEQDCQQVESVTSSGACRFFITVVGFNLLSDNITALSPKEGLQSLGVLRESKMWPTGSLSTFSQILIPVRVASGP